MATLIQDLTQWVETNSGIALTPATQEALTARVPVLLAQGHTLSAVRWGLAIWAVEWLSNPLLPVHHLDRLTWRFAMERSAKARKWREEQRERVAAFGSGALYACYAARRSLQAA